MLFYGEHFSPWCEKARWALDHHQLKYCYHEHVPLIGELALRRASGRYSGVVSVPLLVTNSEALMDSRLIALKAEELGIGPLLFPAPIKMEIEHWNTVSETIMRCGRAMLLERLVTRTDALAEQLPDPLPSPLRKLLVPMSRLGICFVARKYQTQALLPTAELGISHALDVVRKALSGRNYLCSRRFTFADITIATALQFVKPAPQCFISLGPATRAAWANERLTRAYKDLIDWRDKTYEAHRVRAV